MSTVQTARTAAGISTATRGVATAPAARSTMTNAQFDALRHLVRRESAIVLEPGKEYLVESRLAPLARREGMATVGELVDRLPVDPALRAAVVDAMTTNETSFFRDVHPWHTLRDVILPELVEARRASKRLWMWCGACSSGQEPYSLAMVLAEQFPDVAENWDVRIFATDISPTMLDRCRAGRFTQLEVNRGLPATSLSRWFTPEGTSWVADGRLRKMLDVRPGNLAVPNGALPGVSRVDLVLMRNVLIYFDAVTKGIIVDDVHRRLANDGVLMLGSSEVSVGGDQRFDRHQAGRTVYFRPASPATPARR